MILTLFYGELALSFDLFRLLKQFVLQFVLLEFLKFPYGTMTLEGPCGQSRVPSTCLSSLSALGGVPGFAVSLPGSPAVTPVLLLAAQPLPSPPAPGLLSLTP